MSVDYKRLFHRLIDENMSNVALAEKAGITLNVITRLKRNEYVSLESIEKICVALNCEPNEIMEFGVPKNGQQK